LRPAAQEFLAKRLITRQIFAGEVIFKEGAPITHAVFPHDGVVSLMSAMDGGKSVEKSSVGREGLLGFNLVLGSGNAISTSLVQIPGYASWLGLSDLQEALADFVCVRETMLRYAAALVTQALESVACKSLHSAEQRVARWLLEAHDRVLGDRFVLTQQALAQVLGLRRATVSEACSRLHELGAIDYTRGVVTIVDRAGLEGQSCRCHQRIREASLLMAAP
jgi:CRP-like cAMP-binding protein